MTGPRMWQAATRAVTQREQEIANLAATGLNNREIARALNMAPGTVKIHLHNIYAKIGVRNRTALIFKLITGQYQLGGSP